MCPLLCYCQLRIIHRSSPVVDPAGWHPFYWKTCLFSCVKMTKNSKYCPNIPVIWIFRISDPFLGFNSLDGINIFYIIPGAITFVDFEIVRRKFISLTQYVCKCLLKSHQQKRSTVYTSVCTLFKWSSYLICV